MPRHEPAPEFSRPVAVDRIPDSGQHERLEADASERAALARRFDIPEIASLKAHAHLTRTDRGRGVALEVEFEADVVQSCVVTLEPVPQHVAESFSIRYLPPERVAEWEERHRRMGDEGELVDPDAPDPPEPLESNSIDVGEAVAEHLALALDPYPRAPGALFETPAQAAETDEPARPNPFAVLKGRRDDA
jgi:uncharacterized metal-binding protein YceD (DUF177 family)